MYQYYCTTWIFIKCLEKASGNFTKMLHILKESYKTATVQPLTSHLTNHSSKMNKTWREVKVISDIFQWSPTNGHTIVSWPAKTYIAGTDGKRESKESMLSAWLDKRDKKKNQWFFFSVIMVIFMILNVSPSLNIH